VVELLCVLLGIVERGASADGLRWLVQHLAVDEPSFQVAFAGAGRRLGRAAIGAADAERLERAGVPWSSASGVDECGRAALLVAALGALEPARHVPVVRDLVRRGEVRERQTVLRVLAGLPEPARFVELAIDACRTNVGSIFEAIACDNAYPAVHFPDGALCQMVLKALFTGAPVARIVGLSGRITDEMTRMVDAFASERRAAGRPVPDDVHLIARSA
jgi:hypothetical protein